MSKKQPLTRKQKRLLKKRRRRRILFGIEIFILLILIAGVFIYAKLGKMNFTSLDFSKIGVNSGVSNNKVMKGYTTIGLVGLDNRSNKLKSGNSDTMIIASIDNDTKKVKLVSVYRDTYLRIGEDSEGNGQYNRAETFDANKDAIKEAASILESQGAKYRNLSIDSDSAAGKYASDIMAFPTTILVDRNGNIVGEPMLGGIDNQDNYDTLMKQIQSVIDADSAK